MGGTPKPPLLGVYGICEIVADSGVIVAEQGKDWGGDLNMKLEH